MRVHLVPASNPTALLTKPVLKGAKVNPTYLLARDHLQRAAVILQGADQRSLQLRHIIERTIGLMDEFRPEEARPRDNVYELDSYRRVRT